MKILHPLLAFALFGIISGCSILDKKAVLGLTHAGYSGKSLASSLTQIQQDNFFCQELQVGPNTPPVFKRYTSDGTLNDLRMFQCMKETDYFFWITRTYTYVMGQYDKVVDIGHVGSYRARTYLWQLDPPKAVCISKCLNSSGNVE